MMRREWPQQRITCFSIGFAGDGARRGKSRGPAVRAPGCAAPRRRSARDRHRAVGHRPARGDDRAAGRAAGRSGADQRADHRRARARDGHPGAAVGRRRRRPVRRLSPALGAELRATLELVAARSAQRHSGASPRRAPAAAAVASRNVRLRRVGEDVRVCRRGSAPPARLLFLVEHRAGAARALLARVCARRSLPAMRPRRCSPAWSGFPPSTTACSACCTWRRGTSCADHNLNYTDRAGMAAGVEIRVPLLDLDLVRFATRVPARLKQRGRVGKAIFKQAMEPYLPHEVIYRPKSGFGAPLRRWLRHELRATVADTLDAAAHPAPRILRSGRGTAAGRARPCGRDRRQLHHIRADVLRVVVPPVRRSMRMPTPAAAPP